MESMELNVRNALMNAMKGDWRLASALFQDLDMAKLRPDELTLNTRASAASGRWRDAVHLGFSAASKTTQRVTYLDITRAQEKM